MAKLTAKQQRFVDVYDGNAYQAAIKAGYSARTARAIGSENLTKHNIIEAIKARESKRQQSTIMTRRQRQEFWTRVVNGVEGEPEMKERLKASELLGRSEGDFITNVNVSGEPTVIFKDLTGG